MAPLKLLPLMLCVSLLPMAACDGSEELDVAHAHQDEDAALELSELEADSLRWMREEEKLARDVYLTLAESWDEPQLMSVAKSEQQHMDALVKLLDRYGIEDPVVDDSVGVFVDPVLADLYAELTLAGAGSEEAALRVGAAIEELDMVDLQAAIDETDELALIETYESLLCGSRNHLRAFYGGLEQIDAVYEAQYLDAPSFSAIIAGEHEQCS